MSDGRLIDDSELARRLNVPETWPGRQARAGRIPHIMLGRYRRYDWDAVVTWLGTQRGGQWRKRLPSIPPEEDL